MSRLFRRGVNDSPEHTARYQCTSLTRCWLAFDYPMIGYSFLRLSSTSPGNCSFTQKRGPLSLQRARSLTCSLSFEKEILATIYILGGGVTVLSVFSHQPFVSHEKHVIHVIFFLRKSLT